MNHARALLALGLVLLTGCSVNPSPEDWQTPPREQTASSGSGSRDLFVLFDGTRNDPSSDTNVHRLFLLLEKERLMRPSVRSVYIPGVGNARNPITGALFGFGMEGRVNRAYQFVIQNYAVGDRIHIFGFSRGAHQARNLAGLIAYSGVPSRSAGEKTRLRTVANRVIERTKEESDHGNLSKWATWMPGDVPPLAASIDQTLGYNMQRASIRFLGLWDAVPGSAYKDFDYCRERADNKGDRYKLGTYPAILRIAHAISADEKRDRFRPTLACDPIDKKTKRAQVISEMLFPGAHSDVGGGYDDVGSTREHAWTQEEEPLRKAIQNRESLSNISLSWMLDQLEASGFKFTNKPTFVRNDGALAHWPVDEGLARLAYHCQNRDEVPENQAPEFATRFRRIEKHESIARRDEMNTAPVLRGGEITWSDYPMNCAEAER